MWKNNLKNVEFGHLTRFVFLQINGTYFLNKTRRNSVYSCMRSLGACQLRCANIIPKKKTILSIHLTFKKYEYNIKMRFRF